MIAQALSPDSSSDFDPKANCNLTLWSLNPYKVKSAFLPIRDWVSLVEKLNPYLKV